MYRSIRLLASSLILLSPIAMADSQCPPSDGWPWKLPAATDKSREPESYLVLGESQNVPVVVCNCTGTASEGESKSVWVVVWKRFPSAGDKKRVNPSAIPLHRAKMDRIRPLFRS
jgi:hypothetical protein